MKPLLKRPVLQKAAELLVFGAFSIAICAAQSAPQQGSPTGEPLKQLTLEELANLEVTTTSKAPQQISKTSAAIYVITSDDIKRSGATTIMDALRLAPGVEVARIDGSKWAIGIRGFGSRLTRDVLVLIDGRTVYTPLFAGTYWEVQDTLLDDVDRIEVIRGPGGTIWGPNAVNGVINIITKDTKDTHGVLADAGGGNYEQGIADARYGGSRGDNFNYRFYEKAFNRGPEYHFDDNNFDRWRAVRAGFRTDWTPDQHQSLMVEGDLYDEEVGESVQSVNFAPPYSQVVNGNAQLSGGDLTSVWKKNLRDGNDIQLEVYYDGTNRHEPNFGELRNTFDADFVEHLRVPGRQQITWGAGIRESRGDKLEVTTGLTFIPADLTDQLYTGFIQDEIGLIKNKLTLQAGTKLIHTNFTSFQAEPSARLLWTPTNKQTFWAAYTHAVRTPSDADRDFDLAGLIGFDTSKNLPEFAAFLPNPNFAPEQMNGYEVGYRQLLTKSLYVDIATFYNHYNDLFSEDVPAITFLVENSPPPTHELLPAYFGNDFRGNTEGGEIAPEWRPTSFWRLRGSYSYLDMDIRAIPGSPEIEPAAYLNGASPRHQVYAQSSFDIPRGIRIDLMYRYISVLPGDPTQIVPAYSTGNIRVAWQATPHVEFSVVGDDLFQPYHVESTGDPAGLVAIQRSGYAKVTWTNIAQR